jgi:GGDEF domain-containing protein
VIKPSGDDLTDEEIDLAEETERENEEEYWHQQWENSPRATIADTDIEYDEAKDATIEELFERADLARKAEKENP